MKLDSRYVDTTPAAAAASRIAAEVIALSDTDDARARHRILSVAQSVTAYAEQHDCLPHAGSSRLRALMSRALRSVGEAELARRLVVFSTGLARESESSITDDGCMWVLDLERIAIKNSDRLEMALFSCLSSTLDSMAWLWEETCGRGVLGLRYMRCAARAMLGNDGKEKDVLRLCEEMKALCRHKLQVVQQARQWQERPLIIDLDGMARGVATRNTVCSR